MPHKLYIRSVQTNIIMNSIKSQILLFLFSILCFQLFSQDKPAFASMDVFELEWVTSPSIAPDGNTIVYARKGMDIMTDAKTSNLWMINIDGTKHQKLSSFDTNESNPTWSPDGDRIAFTASSKEGTELFMYWVETGKIARISQLENSPGNITCLQMGNLLPLQNL